ncbi:MAG: hypothetical protein ACOX56_05855 [Acholeplasmataceae bacterium]|jgi:hypothetical protein
MAYDYKQRKQEIDKILDSAAEVSTKKRFSNVKNETGSSLRFGHTNEGWTVSLFVDIDDLPELKKNKDITFTKIIRFFASEVIQILNDTRLHRKIGVRDDCIFAVFDISTREEAAEIYNMALDINTLKHMINEILLERKLPSINYGIGIGLTQDIVIKPDKSKIADDLIFIEAVVNASNLSGIASRDEVGSIVMDKIFYENIREIAMKDNPDIDIYFSLDYYKHMEFYHGVAFNIEFLGWLHNGMKTV